jgi:hypothetical protein
LCSDKVLEYATFSGLGDALLSGKSPSRREQFVKANYTCVHSEPLASDPKIGIGRA